MDVVGKTVTGMAEYINREAIMKFPIRKDHCDQEHANEHFINGIESVLEYVENLPAADVSPVQHGRWINANSRPKTYERRCTACGGRAYFCGVGCSYKYCPNCGAKMDLEDER